MTDDPVSRLLQSDAEALDARWTRLTTWLGERFGRETTIEAILFLIGVQSRGRGYEPALQKEVKQDLIMEGTYCVFEKLDLYERIGVDEGGRWIWERRVSHLPHLPIEDQEKLLRLGILAYFADLPDGNPA